MSGFAVGFHRLREGVRYMARLGIDSKLWGFSEGDPLIPKFWDNICLTDVWCAQGTQIMAYLG